MRIRVKCPISHFASPVHNLGIREDINGKKTFSFDYDNDVSDNCDHNFGTFDDFGVNNDQKVSNNMILMSKYKGKHGGKKGQKIRAGVSPPLFGQCPKENIFSLRRASLKSRKNCIMAFT